MLRAMVRLGARETTQQGLDPIVAELRGLAEFPEAGTTAYVIRREQGACVVEPVEVDAETRFGFAFARPSGSQAAQVGPVIKRSFDRKKGAGPSDKILRTTLQHFATVSEGEAPHARIYREALDTLCPAEQGGDDLLGARLRALREVLAGKIECHETAFVSVGTPPGCDASYCGHLLATIRANNYKIDLDSEPRTCPLCGAVAPLAINALAGAEVNFTNLDRDGAFPGVDAARADHRFALCAGCADGLRRFKREVAPALKCRIAGHAALIVPHVFAEGTQDGRAARRAREVVARAKQGTGVARDEDRLLRTLAAEESLAAFHVLWATVGQQINEVNGFLTDVPCTRLRELSNLNLEANRWTGGVLPCRRAGDFDLRLSLFGELLRRPGGARVKRANQGERRAALLRSVCRAVYTRGKLAAEPLWRELREVADAYLMNAAEREPRLCAWDLLNEGGGADKKGAVRLTCAGWVRHVALCLYYLRKLEVLGMTAPVYQPSSPLLAPFFDGKSGIDSPEKAFTFMLGVLFGKLVSVQAARKVNVRSNSLSWLRRGNISGRDLPALYGRVREKLLEYGTEGSDEVREVVGELSRLGARLGDAIELPVESTVYFLLLGQALAAEILPGKKEADKKAEDKS